MFSLHMLEFQIFVSQIAGVKTMFFVFALLLVVLYVFKYKKDFYKIIFISTSAMFVTYTLKYILKVPRLETMMLFEDSYRFPSGHATMAAVVMSLVMYYSYKKVSSIFLRYFLYILAVSWFLLVSYSRIYLHAHLLIDVVVGGLIGVLATVVVMKVFKHFHYYR